MAAHKKQAGHDAEQRACQFLQTKGLLLIAKNFRTVMGEIDLIMRDTDEVVFIEVRSRVKQSYGGAIESITLPKQKKILATALFFLQQRNWLDKINCRFDVIGICQDQLEWIPNAFTADIL